MGEETFDVKNITGERIRLPGLRALEPGVWTSVPRSRAMVLRTRGLVEVRLPSELRAVYTWEDEQGRPTFYWMSPFSVGDGYGTAAEAMVHALLAQGAKLDVRQCWFGDEGGLSQETLRLLKAPLGPPRLLGVCMATPGEFEKLPTPIKAGWTMYESTDPLHRHPRWREQCNGVDFLLVPCEWVAEVYRTFVHRPVHVAPLTVKELFCRPVWKAPRRDFVVGTWGGLTLRKSPLETVDVFRRAFPKDQYPYARLILKTRVGLLGGDIHSIPTLPDDPRIRVIDETWQPSQLLRFIDSLDVGLFLSRAEGFGLPAREGIARGCPTVLTDCTGHSPVSDPRFVWPIRTLGTEAAHPVMGGEWYAPDWDHAVETLRWLYYNREEAFRRAYAGGWWYLWEHGPAVVARRFLDILKEVDPGGNFSVTANADI